MVESFMLIALGFLVAALLALIALQFAWRRAALTASRQSPVDALIGPGDRAIAVLPGTDDALKRKQEEIAALGRRNLALEEAIVTLSRNAQLRQSETADTQPLPATARAKAGLQAQNLELLRERISELETVIASEINQRKQIETRLKELGEKAAQLVQEINEAIPLVMDAHHLQLVQDQRKAGTKSTRTDTTVQIPPAPSAHKFGGEFRELAEIKASLLKTDLAVDDGSLADIEASNGPGERALAERIRALEAGVAS